MVEKRDLSPGTPAQSDEKTARHPGDLPFDDRSTDREIQGELETLESVLRRPVQDDDFEEESGCRRAIERVAAIGRDPFVVPGEVAPLADESHTPPMETLGQYELLAKLGEGGMGAVYKALHTHLQKVVALKVLPADKLKDEDAVARFRREMRAVGKLNHPNIVGAHDAGELDGNHYLVMELVDGIDLSTLVKRFQEAVQLDDSKQLQAPAQTPDFTETLDPQIHFPPGSPDLGGVSDHQVSSTSKGGTPDGQSKSGVARPADKERVGLPIPEACEIICQAAEGLQHAYEHGMVHRDIKPSNLMVALSGQPSAISTGGVALGGQSPEAASDSSGFRTPRSALVKVLDMGLALFDDRHQGTQDLTGTGQVMGTIDYMAPEQGGDSHKVDIRADIYALGATLYKLLAGRAPFADEKYDTVINKLMALATQAPAPLHEIRDDVPRELSDFVARLLAKTPDERPATPRKVAEALAPYAEGAQRSLRSGRDAVHAAYGGAMGICVSSRNGYGILLRRECCDDRGTWVVQGQLEP